MESRKTLLLCFALGFFFMKQTEGFCHEKLDCKSCSGTRNWLGSRCRWCPDSENCHTFASPMNPCHVSKNIKNPRDCPVKESVPDEVEEEDSGQQKDKTIYFTKEDYSPDKAQTLATLSKTAYLAESDIKNKLSGNYRRVIVVSKSCPGSTKFQCAGFAAVSHSDNMIVVVFRGSQNTAQAIDIVTKSLLPPNYDFPAGGKVMPYFRDVFDLIWKPLKSHTYQLIKDYPSYRVYVIGHSLGGAVASLVSTAIVYDGKTSKTRTVLYTFGQPRTGNYDYATKHDELVQASWRVVHYRDVVPHSPPCLKKKHSLRCVKWGHYFPFITIQGSYHHGTEIFYQKDADKSNYKKCLGTPHGEDINCSNGLYSPSNFTDSYNIDDHYKYLDVNFK